MLEALKKYHASTAEKTLLGALMNSHKQLVRC